MEDVYYKVLGTFFKLQRLQKHQTLEQVARAVGHSLEDGITMLNEVRIEYM